MDQFALKQVVAQRTTIHSLATLSSALSSFKSHATQRDTKQNLSSFARNCVRLRESSDSSDLARERREKGPQIN